MKFKIGDTYKIRQSNGSKNNIYKIHILAVIDECKIVYKWYGKHKQWWHYEVQDSEMLEFDIEHCKTRSES